MKRYKSNIFQYIAETGNTNTYGEMLTRCVRTALYLRDKGINKNDIISTCSPNSENSCIPTIAIQLLGAKSTYFDPNLSHLDTVHLLGLIRPKLIFISQDALSFMENCLAKANIEIEIVVIGTSEKYEQFSEYLVPHHQENEFKPESNLDDRETAVIMFSSDTTGFPKGICLSHRSLLGQFDDFRLNKNRVLLCFSNFYWISSLGFLIYAMQRGYGRVVCRQFDAAVVWQLIDEFKVVDLDTEERLGPNHEGELRLKSNKVMNGYYKMDSSSVFDAEGYLKTGDIVWYDEENCFYIVDRIKEMFKYRGWHILPAMLEEVLLTHPAVKEAAVVAIHHQIDGDHPMGLVVLFEGHADITSEEIKSYFNSKVDDSQKLRGGVRIVKELDKTVTGKIKRRAMSQEISNGKMKFVTN